MTTRVRTYRVIVSGFDFDTVFARASSRGRARAIVARAYEGADWGSFGDGLRHVVSARVADEMDHLPLLYPNRGPEGLVASPTTGDPGSGGQPMSIDQHDATGES